MAGKNISAVAPNVPPSKAPITRLGAKTPPEPPEGIVRLVATILAMAIVNITQRATLP